MKPLPGAPGAGAELPSVGLPVLLPMPHVLAWIASVHLARVPRVQAAMLTIACSWEGGLAGSAGRSCYATATCVQLSPTSKTPPCPPTPSASPPCTVAPLPRKAQSKNEKQLKIHQDNRAALQSRQHPLPTQHQQAQTSAIPAPRPPSSSVRPGAQESCSRQGREIPCSSCSTGRTAQVEDRPLSLPACLARCRRRKRGAVGDSEQR